MKSIRGIEFMIRIYTHSGIDNMNLFNTPRHITSDICSHNILPNNIFYIINFFWI